MGLNLPADRRADTYAVYSAVLASPSLSHPDTNAKYLIRDVTGNVMESDLRSCVAVSYWYRASFAELVADHAQHSKERFKLERAFSIAKPYELLSSGDAGQFGSLQNKPDHSTNNVELFRGAVDILTLGNVYFDRKRTLAAVHTGAFCGSLCGFWTWRVFVKNEKRGWEEQNWIVCHTISSLPYQGLQGIIG